VPRVAIQTNLSCRLDWVRSCNRERLALWATYHPGETTRARFLGRCRELLEQGVRFSVGVVGLKEHLHEIEGLRADLPREVYLWVNAYKHELDYYSPAELAFLKQMDPLFPLNNQRHPSFGRFCQAGESAIAVDGEGNIRRCHFICEPIGNIYRPDWQAALRPRPCTNDSCGCHIGYVHLDYLGLDSVFGDAILERIPIGYDSMRGR
jgi:hypothetical protein